MTDQTTTDTHTSPVTRDQLISDERTRVVLGLPRKYTLADARKPISDYDAVVSRVNAENGHVSRSHKHYSRESEG